MPDLEQKLQTVFFAARVSTLGPGGLCMVIKLTEWCSMGCFHCMEDARPEGHHMTLGMFARAIEFMQDLGDDRIVLAGGEPTEHPEILTILDMAQATGMRLGLMTNGTFLANRDMADNILSRHLYIQITNDPRFYPKPLPLVVEGPDIHYVTALPALLRLGRSTQEDGPYSPHCGMVRQICQGHSPDAQGFRALMAQLRELRILCVPSISADGSLHAGESRWCRKIGDLNTPLADLMKALVEPACGKCLRIRNH